MTTMITRVNPTRSEAARDRKAPTPHGQAFTAAVDPAVVARSSAMLAASAKAAAQAARLFRHEMAKSVRRRRRRGEIATDAQLAMARAELDRLSEEARRRIRGKAKRAALAQSDKSY